MQKIYVTLIGVIVVISCIIGAFFYGKFSTGQTTKTTTINESVVRKIAEMATVESKGVLNHTFSTKVAESGILDMLKNFIAERTITVSVPYTAKYGCKLDSSDFKITAHENSVTVYLPEPKLLSYELNLKGMQVTEKNGLAVLEGNEALVTVQGEAYTEGKLSASQDTEKLSLAKNQIREAMIATLSLSGQNVSVIFPETPLNEKDQ